MKIHYSEEILTVMYVFYRSGMGLTADQLVDILGETTQIDYFTAHQILAHLLENKLLFEYSALTGTFLMLTLEAKQALAEFLPKIRASVRDKLDQYLPEHREKLQDAHTLLSDYYQMGPDDYLVLLRAFDADHCLLDMALSVADRDVAKVLSQRWQDRAAEAYKLIIETLTRPDPEAPAEEKE